MDDCRWLVDELSKAQRRSPQRTQGFTEASGCGITVGMLRLRIEDRFALLNAPPCMTTGELIDAALSESAIKNQQSTFFSLHALTFAANEHASHRMRGLAGLGQGRIGAMPFGVVDVVAGRASFAVAALAAGAAMQNDLVRARYPVFINEKLGGIRRWTGGLGNQSDFSRDSLQPGASIAAHGQERQTVDFFDLPHHRQDSLYRQRA